MAAVIGRTQGFTKDGNPKAGEATRLGSSYVRSEANTWRTFVSVVTDADGTVTIRIKRDNQHLAVVNVTPETTPDAKVELWDCCGEPCGVVLMEARYLKGNG